MKLQRFLALIALGSLTLAPAAWSATPEETVNALIPRLADANVPSRYAAQMELQQLAAESSKPGSGAAREGLGKILAAKAADAAVPQPARVWIVRQLEYMGGMEAVPALTTLLSDNDAELRECSRRALEKNPAPAASASLRAALQKGGDTTWKIGLISALGQRADTAAVDLIIPALGDAQTVGFAALALGRIGTPAAVTALWNNLGKHDAVAEGLILAANRAAAPEARAIYQRLYDQKNLAISARMAALTGLAKVDAQGAAPLVLAALSGAEVRLQEAAVIAAPAALGPNYSATLAGELPKLSPRAKTLVLNIVDAAAEKAAQDAMNDADASVRRAAVEALGRMGTGASVPALLALAVKEGSPEKAAAEAALGRINGTGAAAAVEKAADAGDAKQRATAIGALVTRRQISSVPVLLRAAADNDAAVRRAAYGALGRLADESQIGGLVRLALMTKSSEAALALEAAVQRAQDKPAAAKQILAAATDEASQIALLDALAAAGGADALAVVVKLSASANETTREAAINALGNWSDFTAAQPLLALAADANLKDNLYATALLGVVRLIKSADAEPAENRADAAVAALKSARTDDHKKQVISAFGFAPHAKAVTAIKELLVDAKFKADAGQAGVTLAEALGRANQRPAARELAQAIRDAAISPDITRRAERILSR